MTPSVIMAAMAYPGMVPPVRIDPREVRPRRGWYVLAAIIAVISCLTGPVLFLVTFRTFGSIEESLPTIGTQFDAGAPATVELTQAQIWAIYVEVPSNVVDPYATPGGSATPTPLPSPSGPASRCTATAVNGGTIDLADPPIGGTIGVDGRTWRQLYQVTVTQDGQYRLACEPTGPATGTVRYAVGEDPDFAGFFGKVLAIMGSSTGAFVLPCVGLFIAGLIALIVGLRRYSNRRQLQRQRMLPSNMQ